MRAGAETREYRIGSIHTLCSCSRRAILIRARDRLSCTVFAGLEITVLRHGKLRCSSCGFGCHDEAGAGAPMWKARLRRPTFLPLLLRSYCASFSRPHNHTCLRMFVSNSVVAVLFSIAVCRVYASHLDLSTGAVSQTCAIVACQSCLRETRLRSRPLLRSL